jgi:hypothetical protein
VSTHAPPERRTDERITGVKLECGLRETGGELTMTADN